MSYLGLTTMLEPQRRIVEGCYDLLSVLCFLLYKSVTGIEAPIGNSSLSISAAGSNVNSSLSLWSSFSLMSVVLHFN